MFKIYDSELMNTADYLDYCKDYISNSVCKETVGDECNNIKDKLLKIITSVTLEISNHCKGIDRIYLLGKLDELVENLNNMTEEELIKRLPNKINKNSRIFKVCNGKLELDNINIFHSLDILDFQQGKKFLLPYVNANYEQRFEYHSISSKEYPGNRVKRLLDCDKYDIESEDKYVHDVLENIGMESMKSSLLFVLNDYIEVVEFNENFSLSIDSYKEEISALYKLVAEFIKVYNLNNLLSIRNEFADIIINSSDDKLSNILEKLADALKGDLNTNATSTQNGSMNLF